MRRSTLAIGSLSLSLAACGLEQFAPGAQATSSGAAITEGTETPVESSRPVGVEEVTTIPLPPTFTPSPTADDIPTPTLNATPTLTVTPLSSATKVPTPTPSNTPTLTPFPSPTGPTLTPTLTISPFPYVLVNGYPQVTSYFANIAVGCDWAGLAGQVVDKNGVGAIGITAHVTGTSYDEKSVSGSYNATYGPGGWEVFITDHPVARTYTVRLETVAGQPLSEGIVVTTISTCEANLMLLNFKEVP